MTKVIVHSIHFDADKQLVDFIQGKVNKLNHFYTDIIGGEVFLKVDNTVEEENKVAEVKLSIPGKELFAKKTCKSFEEATDTAVEAIRRQMRKYVQKTRKQAITNS